MATLALPEKTLVAQRQGKYLVFQLAREEFGVQVLKVREIMGLQEITSVPQTPGFAKGVINLRGKVSHAAPVGPSSSDRGSFGSS